MSARAAGSLSIEPRGLAREDAAAYVGVGTTLFDRMVQDGRMPKSARIDGRVIWDRRQLDRAMDRLFDRNDQADPYAHVA